MFGHALIAGVVEMQVVIGDEWFRIGLMARNELVTDEVSAIQKIGKRVALSYVVQNVMSPACQGDPKFEWPFKQEPTLTPVENRVLCGEIGRAHV